MPCGLVGAWGITSFWGLWAGLSLVERPLLRFYFFLLSMTAVQPQNLVISDSPRKWVIYSPDWWDWLMIKIFSLFLFCMEAFSATSAHPSYPISSPFMHLRYWGLPIIILLLYKEEFFPLNIHLARHPYMEYPVLSKGPSWKGEWFGRAWVRNQHVILILSYSF